ncbi:MAG: hypothetical protein OJJ54_21240 [Pseudonocardia sp.]|nr:hypothetical protein [Pseudonocardia sp.]
MHRPRLRRPAALAAASSLLMILGLVGTALALEDRNCSAFAFQEDAQAALASAAPDSGLAGRLDRDGNGRACETLPHRDLAGRTTLVRGATGTATTGTPATGTPATGTATTGTAKSAAPNTTPPAPAPAALSVAGRTASGIAGSTTPNCASTRAVPPTALPRTDVAAADPLADGPHAVLAEAAAVVGDADPHRGSGCPQSRGTPARGAP